MKFKILNKLIVFGAFAFILFSYNSVFAYVPGVWEYQPRIQTNEAAFSQIPMNVDYSYKAVPITNTVSDAPTVKQTSTLKTTIIPTTSTNQVNPNDLTALSMNGSNSFMPSSIWQWILVILLILAIIVMARSFVKKPHPGDAHAAPAH